MHKVNFVTETTQSQPLVKFEFLAAFLLEDCELCEKERGSCRFVPDLAGAAM